MNVNAILNYEADPNEDYYNLLGCDSSASTEQIIAEYKAKAKDYHPDKNNTADDYDQLQSREKFQHLLRVSHAYVRDATVNSSEARPRVIEGYLKEKVFLKEGIERSSQTRCLLLISVYKPNQHCTVQTTYLHDHLVYDSLYFPCF